MPADRPRRRRPRRSHSGVSITATQGGDGLLLNQRLATDSATTWQTMAASASLRYVVAPGAPADAIKSLTRITGRHPVPPDWALAYDKNNCKSKLDDAPAKIDARQLPIQPFTIHCWSRRS